MKKIVIYLLAIFLVVFAGNYFYNNKQVTMPEGCDANSTEGCAATTTATTTPIVETSASSTKTIYDKTQGITYSYPDNFYFEANLTEYVHPVDWPPTITVSTSTYACKVTGNKISPTGKTELKNINGHRYCLTTASEGAAGSTYTTYTYLKQNGAKNVTLSFVTRTPQCLNYDEPKQSACKKEVAEFSIDNMADLIFASVKLDK